MKKVFLLIPIFVLCFLNATGQNVIGVVDYHKVDNPEEYLAIEKEWEKIHAERKKQGMIKGWATYQVMFKTIDDPYNYITVSWYDAFSKLDKSIPESVIKAAFPEMTKEEWKSFEDKTNNSRTLVASSVFHQRFTSADDDLDHEGFYYVINEISVKPSQSKELLKLYEEVYKPLYEEDIRHHNRTLWSFWEKWPGNSKNFQFLAADGYTSLDQIGQPNFMQYFSTIHPDKNPEKINERMEKLKTLINTEMWKKIYRLD